MKKKKEVVAREIVMYGVYDDGILVIEKEFALPLLFGIKKHADEYIYWNPEVGEVKKVKITFIP